MRARIPARDGQQPAYAEPDQVSALAPEALRERMDAVLCAEVIILIYAADVIRVVIDQVVGTVRDKKPQGEDQPHQEIKRPAVPVEILPGEQAADQPGIKRDRADRGTGGDKPLRENVQRVPFPLILHADQLGQRLAPH